MNDNSKTISGQKQRWTKNVLNKASFNGHSTDWGDPIDALYTPDDFGKINYPRDIGFPAEYPFVRGVHPSMS